MTMFRRNKSLVALIMSLVLLLAAGCGSASAEATPTTYDDYQFWQQENTLRIAIPLAEEALGERDIIAGIEGIGDLDLSSKYLKRTEVLKEAMITYFLEVYDIDISEKLAKQKLKAFKVSGENEGVMGYVSKKQPEYLNLNKTLFGENKLLFDHTYVHESLHQIGFQSENTSIITEGIVDALTDLILERAGILAYPTPIYNDTRAIGYQILIADKDIPEFFLGGEEKVDIVSRIDEVLSEVEQTIENIESPGKRLDDLLNGLTYGMHSVIDPYYIAFEYQEITRAYCQEFNPDEKAIDEIRQCYLVLEYEHITIEKNVDRYDYFFEE